MRQDETRTTAALAAARSSSSRSLPADGGPPGAPDEELDRFAAMARRLLEVPVALVTLVDADAPSAWCAHVVASGQPVVLPDVRTDDRFGEHPAIGDLQVRAYAGMPVTGADGRVVGALCALADEPREFTPADLANLHDLAAACSSCLARRELERHARAAERVATRSGRQARLLLRFSEALVHTTTEDEVLAVVRALAHSALGATYAEVAVGDRRGVRYVSVDDLPAGTAPRWRTFVPGADLPGPRVMRTGRPLIYPDEAAAFADFPLLRDDPTAQAVRARAFLPLSAGGRPLGWLGLGWGAPRAMDDDFRELMASLARTTSQALQRAALIQERREVAHTLQDALLSTLPTVPGLELAARYRPASAADKVGGDWYDALAFPTSTTLVIGDVAGHDVAAAAEMGHLRSILRGFAVDRADSPAQLLGRLDRASLALGSGTVATALVARLGALGSADPSGADLEAAVLTWSSAGHYAPLLVHADGRTAQLSGRSDLLLGIDGRVTRTDWVDRVPRGSTLLLFTDGLVELRGHHIGDRIDALRVAAGRMAGAPLDVLLDAVLAAMAHRRDQDDVAVLAARPVGPVGPGGAASSS
ncbi:GAF domain-containing SpoIIE family protein phosphatase [Pengzhenrongella phosphoraccumulans]|uniref:GAF domain-containing SpoIIE family protein phosphatase n=1 Tax=Pengzhenrongella phosphoraccumulans TaxID=3114394 RepID=UPI00388E72C9